MSNSKSSFQRTLLASSIAACVFAGGSQVAVAQSSAEGIEEVTVTGIRKAQEDSVSLKRDASQIVDGISAEDIGKLPDVTITDSLQRIPGVSIRRSAGEGSTLIVRGLPQVGSQLNGEAFMSAGSITTVQPSYGDLPSQLFKGADVYKTSSANLSNAGITGTINLKTHRPFDFDDGFTAAGSVEVQQGQDTGETDPVASGLVNWKTDTVGVMVSASYANTNLANYYNGFNTGNPTGDASWVNGINSWGGNEPINHLSPQGFAAWNQVTERERVGFNGSFQADLGEGFQFTADAFFTQQDEYNRKVGMSVTNKWQGLDWFNDVQGRNVGVQANGQEWMTVSRWDMNPKRLKSFTQNDSFLSDSTNVSLQLDYDNGGKLTGSMRYVQGDATRKRRHGYNEGDMTDGTSTGIAGGTFYPAEYCAGVAAVGDDGGCYLPTNPLGYTDNPQLVLDTSGSHGVWSGFNNTVNGGLGAGATISDYMSNLDSYNIGAFSSENNADSQADFRAFRMDGSYAFDEGKFFTSVDIGLRSSTRSVEETRFHLFSPFYAGYKNQNGDLVEDGCGVQWKATDVILGNPDGCTAGEMVNGDFVGYTALPPTALDQHNNVMWVTDFGPVKGIPGVWAVNPKDYDDPVAFHNRVFGSTQRMVIPGTSYGVEMKENSFYVQGNFEAGIMSGNVGVRVIETDLLIVQNLVGDGIPYGNTNVDNGDNVSKRSYVDILPSLNLAFDVTDAVKIRAAYAKNMTPLDLAAWGDGRTISTSLDSTTGQFEPNAVSDGGNPNLDPWRSDNFDLSAEWYVGDASMASIGTFLVDVESFPIGASYDEDFILSNGSIRTIPVSGPTQGEGGQITGVEIAGKLALSDLADGFISGFGIDANFTYSPSESDQRDINDKKLPFPENSETQYNLVLWYEQYGLQARIAYNYRSERFNGTHMNMAIFQKEAAYVDMSVSYDITDDFTVYMNGSNITGEYEDYYMQWEDQYAFQNYYEPRYTLGLRARF
ncbi:TonB-dependent receptor [Simiduia agarivorans]|uniref:TonB-dependent receptor n=1 Tax=Simiduia agarivorans (strain DSM 21679 / JCM 13881 / BCRC 17597 / SA1) TaxID=1117647 RepID=K4KGQ8_SIMAS|nr:TonB-dependent receptor [Simiduia agarivorans]AFU98284.1 TonB-dependent receptor [Simiduia agarivorans SA1 = DSM 21679]